MKFLDQNDARIRNIAVLQFLEPFGTHARAGRYLGALGGSWLPKQFIGSIKKWSVHVDIIGRILPVRQPVELYPPEALYRDASLAYENMQEIDDDHPLAVLARNVHDIKKVEKGLSNARVAASAQRRGHATDIAKTVSNIERKEHGVGINNIVTVAEALDAEPWQLFLPGVPKGDPNSPNERAELSWLVRTFLALSHGHRRTLLENAKLLILAEGKPELIDRQIPRAPAVSAMGKSRQRGNT